MPVTSTTPEAPVWFARHLQVTGGPAGTAFYVVLSDAFPAGTAVDLPAGRPPTGWRVAVRREDGGTRVLVPLRDAPLLWYVEATDPEADPVATTLIAFSDPRHPDGTLLDQARATAEGVDGDDQVAALRWWPASGLVHQLYVGAAHRRRGVAGKLVRAAFGLQAARGLPGLHGDGRRTELGERWRHGQLPAVAGQMAALSELMAPMTPEGAGVRR